MSSPLDALYIHIPFCSSICLYCDFTKLLYQDGWAFAYLEALLEELDLKYKNKKFSTIYIGGGTPNCLPLPLLERLLKAIQPHLRKKYEFTIECNPEFVSEALVKLLKKYGVNRVSMGLESADPALLKAMGRHHDFKKAQEAVYLLKKAGIINISIDIIYALPGETMEIIKRDLEAVLSLDVPHISAYSYIQEKNSIWTRQGIEEAPSDEQGAYYEAVEKALLNAGYDHYEISSYARKGYQSKHNKAYWKDRYYGALGLGASGYEGDIRYKNTLSLPKYLKGEYFGEEETVTKEDDIHYFLMTNLRLKEGFSLKTFTNRFGFDIVKEKREIIEKECRLGLLELTKARLKPTYLGMKLLDSILLELF